MSATDDRVPMLARLLLWAAVLCVAVSIWQVRQTWMADQENKRLNAALVREQAETARERAVLEQLRTALVNAPASAAEPIDQAAALLALDLAELARANGLTLTQRTWRGTSGSNGDGDLRGLASTDARSGLAAITLAFDLSFPTRTGLARWFGLFVTRPVQLLSWRTEGDRAHVEVRLYGERVAR
ncbi:MAG: hypothetical protein JSS40_04145 [Proteobacteria bacterium]|nr:hypothetical protein [Pseudomonadota bacterium]